VWPLRTPSPLARSLEARNHLLGPTGALELALTGLSRVPDAPQEFEADVEVRNGGAGDALACLGGRSGTRSVPSNVLHVATDDLGENTLIGSREWPDVGGTLLVSLAPQGTFRVHAVWRAAEALRPGRYRFSAVYSNAAPERFRRSAFAMDLRRQDLWVGTAISAPVMLLIE